MVEVLVVLKTRMQGGVCVGGVVLGTHQSVRLIPPGARCQPEHTPLQIGQVWDMIRGSGAPFVEDADAVSVRLVRVADVARHVRENLTVVRGDTSAIYDGRLRWNQGRKGFLDRNNGTAYSTQFWQPARALHRYEDKKPSRSFHFLGA